MRIPGVLRMAGTAFQAWQADRVPPMGAALAYYTLFAMGPVLLVVIAVAGTVFGPAAARGELVGQIDDLIGPDVARVVETVLSRAGPRQGSVFVTIFGLAAIVLTASGAFLHLRNSMNTIWRVRAAPGPKRNVLGDVGAFILRRLRAFALVVPLAFVFIVALAASTALRALGGLVPLPSLVSDLLNFALSLAVLTLGFGIIYRLLADVRLRWDEVWIGSLITSLLFTVGNQLLTLYLVRSATASIFGAASSVVIVLIWVYYSAQIVLYGAEYSRVYFRARRWRRAHAGHSRTRARGPRWSTRQGTSLSAPRARAGHAGPGRQTRTP